MKYSMKVGDLVRATDGTGRKGRTGHIGVVIKNMHFNNEVLVHFQDGKSRWVTVYALEKL